MTIDWGSIVTQLLIVLLPILVTALITWVSALAAKALKNIKDKYPQWADVLNQYAPLAVDAAEQLRKTGVLPTAADAEAYAVKTVQSYLEAHGIKNVDVTLIEAAVESAVSKLPPFGSVAPTTTTTTSGPGATTTTTTEPAPVVDTTEQAVLSPVVVPPSQ